MEKQLNDLTKKLTDALGDRIVSLVLYGSAAAGDWQERASDLNILCVLKRLGVDEMKLANPVFAWWTKQGNLPPVLMTEDEILHSTDCFPLEFHDIQERHRVLLGRDIAAELKVDFRYYRALVEKEIRSKHLRLRQKSIELVDQPGRLLTLMLDSISTFCALGRHALILARRPVHWKKQEILAAISDATGQPLAAANRLLVLREGDQKLRLGDVLALLDQYLRDTDVIVGFVDSLDRS